MADPLDLLIDQAINPAPQIESGSFGNLDSLIDDALAPQIGKNLFEGLTSPVKNIKGAVSGVVDIGKSGYEAATTGDTGAIKRTLRGVGSLGAGAAGAGAGASAGAALGTLLAPFTLGLSIPAGALIGGAGGGALGLLGFNKVADVIETGEPSAAIPTKEDIEQAAYNTGAGLQFGAAPKIVKSGVSSVSKLKNLVSKGVEPLTETGQRLIAKNILNNVDATLESKIDSALATAKSDPYFKYKTTAEVADSPALATAEQALTTGDPAFAAALTEKAGARNLARIENVNKIAPETALTKEAFGELIKENLKQKAGTLKEAAGALYEKTAEIAGDAQIPLYKAKRAIFDAKNKYFGEGAGPMPAELASIYEELQTAKTAAGAKSTGTKPYQVLQNMRSRAAELSYKYKVSGDKRAAAVAGEIASSIDNAITSAAVRSKILPADAAKAWTTARGLYSTMKKTYETGDVAKVFKEKSPLKESKVLTEILKDPESALSYKKAIGKDPQTITAVRSQILDDLITRSSSLSDGQLVNNTFNKYLAQKSGALEQFFTKKHLTDLQKIAEDLKSSEQIRAKARSQMRGGSDTAQKLNVAQYLKDSISQEFGIGGKVAGVLNKVVSNRYSGGAIGAVGGSVMGGPWGAAAGAALGEGVSGALRKLSGKYVNQIEKIIMKAAENPKFASELLKEVTPQRVSYIDSVIRPKIDAVKTEYAAAVAQQQNEKKKQRKPQKATEILQSAVQEEKASEQGNATLNSILDAIRHVESRGNAKAVSKAGAKGAYQFMPETAAAYGLKDPFDEKASREAAGKLIADEFEALGSLPLALAAYNAGRPAVLKAVKKAGSTKWADIVDFLPEETQNYVPLVYEQLR